MAPFTYFVLLSAIATVASAASLAVAAPMRKVLPLRPRSTNTTTTTVPITAAQYGTVFDIEVQLGNQTFLLLFDTGSSDTWVVQTGFECINATDDSLVSPAACDYAGTYDISSTFKKIDNETFGVQYGTGIATGITGYEDVTVGGVTVKRQQIGVVNRATNPGDGIDSGIVGFGYPSLTSAHPGTEVSNGSQLLNRTVYNPLFQNMYEQGSVQPFFAVALERTPYNTSISPGGLLTLGFLPPIPHSLDFAAIPVEITDTIPLAFTNGTSTITEWTLSVSKTVYGAVNSNQTLTNSTSFQAVVDVGNPQNVLPLELAQDINGKFDPPAVFDNLTNNYLVQCNATAPILGFEIGNQTFKHNGSDLIIQVAADECISAIGATVPTDGVVLNFLGDAFLKNVVAVFDFGKNEMRFAARLSDSNLSAPSPPVTPIASSVGADSVPSLSLLVFALLIVFIVEC